MPLACFTVLWTGLAHGPMEHGVNVLCAAAGTQALVLHTCAALPCGHLHVPACRGALWGEAGASADVLSARAPRLARPHADVTAEPGPIGAIVVLK